MAPLAFQPGCLVITIFTLPGSGLLTASKVFLPITTTIPQVVFLKNFRSFVKCQSNWLSLPMALFSEAATTSDIIILVKELRSEKIKKLRYFRRFKYRCYY